MKFKEMYYTQSKLDKHIGEKKNINMDHYKTERIIALQVEFNELLNELPFVFKYWANKEMDKEKAMEEFIDVTHFMLSIGNDMNIKEHTYNRPSTLDTRELVMKINGMIPSVSKENYGKLFNYILLLGEQIGFTNKDIVRKYKEKNKENYKRQEENY